MNLIRVVQDQMMWDCFEFNTARQPLGLLSIPKNGDLITSKIKNVD